ncbi:PaaI family thioesterase [Acetivibrio cellulolyticus]|uniref:PaaI family thioesterase n=1 Tax=Acetivibrio cellulolyticus TaxID=35830 RepID=UPI0001E2D50B|nr:PaaI family thioesterase [Acetivibrio cellulolyticus]
MKYKVTKKQQNSRLCLVCGLKNDFGLKTSFYELENGELVAVFKTLEEHQSYPGRLHGGIAGAVLDETIGRAIMINQENIWGVTVELNVKYKKPIPLNEELRAVGRIIKDSKRIFEGTGEILLPTGEVAAIAHGTYMKMPIEKIADFNEDHEEWKTLLTDSDPEEIELPDNIGK